MTGKPIGRAQIERAEKIAEELEARRQAQRDKLDANRAKWAEEYLSRLAAIEAVREASRWVRPASLEVARVTMRPTAKKVYPEFEEWQLAIALESLRRRESA